MTIHIVSIVSRMNLGGPAVLLSELANNIDTDSYTHTLVTGYCEANEVDYLDTNEFKGKVIRVRKLSRSIFLINEIGSLISLIRILHSERPDVIHTHMSKAGVLGRIAARFAAPRAKVVHTYHGHLLYGYFNPLITRAIVIIERFLALISDALVAITNNVKNDLLNVRVGRENKWRLIRLGIQIEPIHDRFRARAKLGIKNDEFVIVWIGRFEDIKNPQLAIDSFASLASRLSAKMIMLGGGGLLEGCQQRSDELQLNIEFPGWVEDKYRYLPAADLLLMTSKNEGLGMVMLEAATQGIPTLSTKVGGVSEFISDGVTGFFARDNVQDFAEKIEEIASNDDMRIMVGLKARTLVNSQFSSEIFVKKHEDLYRELLK